MLTIRHAGLSDTEFHSIALTSLKRFKGEPLFTVLLTMLRICNIETKEPIYKSVRECGHVNLKPPSLHLVALSSRAGSLIFVLTSPLHICAAK